MNNRQDLNDEWQVCLPGTLASAVRHIQSNGRRKPNRIVRATFVTVSLCALGIGFNSVQLNRASVIKTIPVQTLACGEVAEMLPAYMQARLETTLIWRVDEHLASCPDCRERVEQMLHRRPASKPASKLSQIDGTNRVLQLTPNVVAMTH